MGAQSFDLVVVGAGIVGMGTAWEAAQRGARVCVVERGVPACGASGAAVGLLSPAELGVWQRHGPRVVAAQRAWRDWGAWLESGTGLGVDMVAGGAVRVAWDDVGRQELRELAAAMEQAGAHAELVGATDAREREPALSAGVVEALVEPGCACVDTQAVGRALVAACEAAGVVLRSGLEVTGLVLDDGACRGVRTADGAEVFAAATLVACGAWSGSLPWLPEQVRPGVRPVTGEVLVVRPPAGAATLNGVVFGSPGSMAPRAGGLVAVGATLVDDSEFPSSPTDAGRDEVLAIASRVLPRLADAEVVQRLIGQRPFAPVGAATEDQTEIDGLLVAAGHHRNGILFAPLAAERMAGLALGQSVAAG
jgi:glycine oxidase